MELDVEIAQEALLFAISSENVEGNIIMAVRIDEVEELEQAFLDNGFDVDKKPYAVIRINRHGAVAYREDSEAYALDTLGEMKYNIIEENL